LRPILRLLLGAGGLVTISVVGVLVALGGPVARSSAAAGEGPEAMRSPPAVGSVPQGAPSPASAPTTTCVGAALEQRAARVLIVGLPGVTSAEHDLVARLAQLGVGGVLLRRENLLDVDQAAALVRGLRERLGPDLLVAVDEEGGRVRALADVAGNAPSARRLGRAGPDAAASAGAELASLLVRLGIDWVMAPVLDLDGGPADGLIGDRSFSADAAVAATTAAAFAAPLRAAGIAITLKHYPGHGGDGDPHFGGTVDWADAAELVGTRARAFQPLIDAGADAVMVGHVTYPHLWGESGPASLEPQAYALLRAQGFDGVAVTDALGMGAIHSRWGFDAAPAMALAAGADAVLVNQGQHVDELVDGVVDAVRRGDLSEARLDEAAHRVLAVHGQSSDFPLCSARAGQAHDYG
jgi:beta-N-acetylhexosaminidase